MLHVREHRANGPIDAATYAIRDPSLGGINRGLSYRAKPIRPGKTLGPSNLASNMSIRPQPAIFDEQDNEIKVS